MKKYLKPVLALVLVAALAIGGTLAYLTDVTDEKENSFTVTEKIDIKLEESKTDFELIPGTSPTKDPTITIVEDSSYVFTQVVETIPTKALDNGKNKYATFVDYTINAIYKTGTAGQIYRTDSDGDVTGDAIDWYWAIVDVTDTADGTDDNIIVDKTGYYVDTTEPKQGPSTTYTYVYALVDENGALLSVSSTDLMVNPLYTDGQDGVTEQYITAEFPILAGDKVTIPEDLTQEELALLLTDADDDGEATYDVLLSFTGYAIQTAGLDDLTTNEAIYNAAKGTVAP